METKEFCVQNLNCASCSAKIEREISSLPEVVNVNLDMIGKKLSVEYHVQTDGMNGKDPHHAMLEKLNYIADSIEPGTHFTHEPSINSDKAFNYNRLVISLGLIIYILAAVLAPPYREAIYIISYLLAAHRVIYYSLKKLFKAMVFDEHFLMSLATLGAVYLGQYFEAVAVMVLYEIGQYLETLSITRSRNTIKQMLSIKAEIAHVQTTEGLKDNKLAFVKVGDS
ncbi:MAG: heavy metal translocating P-type ATPase, partial [Candidatus Cloacimonadaceae bacterium]|nr:heavy metal translocating P-type ATPase [Candidatus Cloacimonadaceae bacterium]